MRFQKKPVIVEARLYDVHFVDEVAGWCNGRIAYEGDDTIVLRINTLEGVMTARPGDWIIRGVQGEFYPCKPDIFEATYEPVVEKP